MISTTSRSGSASNLGRVLLSFIDLFSLIRHESMTAAVHSLDIAEVLGAFFQHTAQAPDLCIDVPVGRVITRPAHRPDDMLVREHLHHTTDQRLE